MAAGWLEERSCAWERLGAPGCACHPSKARRQRCMQRCMQKCMQSCKQECKQRCRAEVQGRGAGQR